MSGIKTSIILVALLSYAVSATPRKSLRKVLQHESNFGKIVKDANEDFLEIESSRFLQGMSMSMSMSMGSIGSAKVSTLSPTSSPTSLSDVINKPPEEGYYTYDDDTTISATAIIPTQPSGSASGSAGSSEGDSVIATTTEQSIEVETQANEIDEPITSSPPTKINFSVVGAVVGIAAAVIAVAAIIMKRTNDKRKSLPSDLVEENGDLEQ